MPATSMVNAIESHEVVTAFIKALLKSGANPSDIITGLHNSFVHGEAFDDAGIYFVDDELKKVFEHIEELSKAVKSIEDSN